MNHFEIIYGLVIVKVTRLYESGRDLYQLQFPNEVPDIKIECIRAAAGETYWDTVPAGNRELGAAIGKLVTDHLAIGKE